jgi:hypothetical protein
VGNAVRWFASYRMSFDLGCLVELSRACVLHLSALDLMHA